MNDRSLTALGLKWNPFLPDVPVEAIWSSPRAEYFYGRIERQVRDGGFALITGDPGAGKSTSLRLLAHRLGKLRDVSVGVVTHPRSRLADFYREMGDLFGTAITASNRWGGFKVLREKWLAHIDTTLTRPVLLIDEAQSMYPEVLSELRLLASTDFDSRAILTVVLAGDTRLTKLLATEELLPLGSRIRARLTHDPATVDELRTCVAHRMEQAGHAQLMTPALVQTLCEHSLGNYRMLCTLAGELLDAALAKDLRVLDEKLYLDVFASAVNRKSAPKAPRRLAPGA